MFRTIFSDISAIAKNVNNVNWLIGLVAGSARIRNASNESFIVFFAGSGPRRQDLCN